MSRYRAIAAAFLFGPLFFFVPSSAARAADLAAGLEAYDAGRYEEAFAQWEPLALNGDIEAQVLLANLYLTGEGVARDPVAAAAWYREAALHGDPVAQLNLGELYLEGEGVPRDPIEAYIWLSLAAAHGREWAEDKRASLARGFSAEDFREVAVRAEALAVALQTRLDRLAKSE